MEYARRLAPQTTALLIIDMQVDFCSPNGVYGQAGVDVSACEQIIPALSALIKEAHVAGVRVVFVRTEHDSTTDSPAWLARKEGAGKRSIVYSCRSGTSGCNFYGVAPQPGDFVVTKHRYSAFVGTRLHLFLRSNTVNSLVFTGVGTSICVESSLRDGLQRDYHVALVSDCTASRTRPSFLSSLETVGSSFGPVFTSREIIDYWRSEIGRDSAEVTT